MIIIAFDFGMKNIGIAVGEHIVKKGRPLNSIKALNGTPDWNIIKNLLKNWKPKFVIVGLPLNMDGSEQNITKKSRQFANLLKYKFNVLVQMHDERLTTIEAKSIIFKNGGFKKLQRQNIHSFSAVIILESWINKNIFTKYNK